MQNGARRTLLLRIKQYPGHRVPYRIVHEFINACAICLKDRFRITDTMERVIQRSKVSVDGLTVTPPDKPGNNGLIVIVEHFTKHVAVYRSRNQSAQS